MSPDAQSEADGRRAAETAKAAVYFDATLRPHRSLGPRGFLIIMSAIAATGFFIGLAFFLAGAWPVAGFCGLEILLLYIAFKLNYRDGRRAEHLRLSDPGGLAIARVAPNGKRSEAWLEPTWLKVAMDDPPKHDSMLRLRTHGRETIIGAFLTPGERLEVADALRAALERYRAADLASGIGPDTAAPSPAAAPAGQAGGSG